MYTFQVRNSLAVFSYETALFHYDLSARDPLNYTITIPIGYNATKFKESGSEVYYVKRELGRNIGMRDVYPHKFRRTIASRAIDKGMPIEQV